METRREVDVESSDGMQWKLIADKDGVIVSVAFRANTKNIDSLIDRLQKPKVELRGI